MNELTIYECKAVSARPHPPTMIVGVQANTVVAEICVNEWNEIVRHTYSFLSCKVVDRFSARDGFRFTGQGQWLQLVDGQTGNGPMATLLPTSEARKALLRANMKSHTP